MPRLSRWVIPSALIGLAGLCVLVVPWWIPVTTPTYSGSYTYGFNNAFAWISLAVIIALLAWWRLAGSSAAENAKTETTLANLLAPDPHPPVSRDLASACAGFVAIVLVLIAWWFWFLPYAYFGESQYFLPRIDLMLLGQQPYRDFQFSYGPTLLLLPYGIYQLTSVSVESSYEIALLLHWLLGSFCLFYVIRSLGGTWARSLIFLLLALSFINFTFGLNYTPLRFALPLASLVALHRSASRPAASLPRFLGLCVLLPMLNFAVSPEMGIVTTAASGAYALLLWRTSRRQLAWGALAVALGLPLTVLVFTPDYFHSILTYAGGGNNFPIFPTIHVVAYLAALLFLLPWLAVVAWRHRSPAGALAAALLTLFGLQIIPSLGRCDPRHVFMNGLGVFLIALACWSMLKPRAFTWAALVYGIVFLGSLQLSSWNTYQDFIFRAFDARERLNVWRERNGELDWSAFGRASPIRYGKLGPPAEDLRQLLAYDKIGAPFGCEESVDRFLKFTGRNVTEYYPGPVIDVFRQPDIERKEADIQRMDTILVPANLFADRGRIDLGAYAARESKYLTDAMVLPLQLTVRNPPFVAGPRVMEAIAADFEPVAKFRRYVIAKRKPK